MTNKKFDVAFVSLFLLAMLFSPVAAQNNTSVSVSSALIGESIGSSESIVGLAVNSVPLIDSFYPVERTIELGIGERQGFDVKVSDADDDLSIKWLVGEREAARGDNYVFSSQRRGTFEVKVVVSDGIVSVWREWSIIVGKQPAASKIVPAEQKIQKELKAKIAFAPDELVKIIILVENEKDLERVGSLVEVEGGKLEGLYKVGNVVVANVLARNINKIAKEPEIKSVWSDTQVQALLDTSVPQIGAPALWSLGFQGENVRVAVLDTGIDKDHPMLQGKVLLESNFSSSPTVMDNYGHGTHVAGIIAGTTALGGLYNGVAPQALLYNAKVLGDDGSGAMSSVISAINWALDPDSNPQTSDQAHVINMSFGAPTPYNQLEPIHSAISEATSSGVLVVVSSGNCGAVEPSSNCSGYIGVTTPGNSPDALSVGAVDDFNNGAPFSSGENIPGVGIKPDVVAPGVSIVSSMPLDTYEEQSGTSMSAPHATGAAALLLNANQLLTPPQIKGLLELNAIDFGATGKDTSFGFGLINLSSIINPNAVLSEESVSGSIDEDQIFTENITITNHGAQELLIYDVTATSGIEFSIGESSLLAAQSTDLNFSISGAAVGVGTYNGQIDINTNSGVKTVLVSLQVNVSTNPIIRSFNIPVLVFRGQLMDIDANVTDDSSVSSVNVRITDPFGVTTDLPLVFVGDGLWRYLQYQFPTDPSYKGRYDVNVVAVDDASNTTVFETHFELVNALFFLSEEFTVNQQANLGFAYKNTWTTSREATAVAQVYNETGFPLEELSQAKDVASNETADFNLLWLSESIGNYSLRLKFFEDSTLLEELDENITVLVPDALEITGFSVDSNVITKGDTQTYSVWVENLSAEDLNAIIEINVVQNGLVVDVITIEDVVVLAGLQQMFNTSNQVLLSGGSYEVITKLHYGNRVEEGILSNFEVFTPPSGSIVSINLPPEIFIDQNHLVQVDFRNTGNVSLDVVLEGAIMDGNQIVDSIDFNAAQVPPTGTMPFTFEALHEFKGLSGEYLLQMTANYEGNLDERDENLFVFDDKLPIINNLVYDSEVKKNDPFIVRVSVEENSDIGTATLSVNLAQSDLEELFSFDANHFLIGTFYDTSTIQQYDFSVEVCDEFGNCSSTPTQNFNVVDCVGEKLLLVAEEDYFAELFEPSYCVSRWKKSESGVPSLEYLQRFDALVWSESSDVSNIDENQALLLENYVAFGGKILLEGDEIAFRHRDNNFMTNVAHSRLAEDLIFVTSSDSNDSTALVDSNTIFVTRSHPITQGLGVLDVNIDISLFPDSITPVNSGVSLADWNASDSAMVIFNDHNTSSAKGIFLPFNFNALDDAVKPLFLENIIQWLLEDSSIDLAVNSINVPSYIVEQSSTPVEIALENNMATEVDIYVDGELQVTVPTSTNTAQANINFFPGEHVIEAQINPSFSIGENYYVNNSLEKEVWVATTEADLMPESFTYFPQAPLLGENVQIDVNILNAGGTSVDAEIEFFVDENLVDTQSVYVRYSSQATASALWTAELGVHDLRIVASSAASDSNSLNNELVGRLYVCSGPSILVVSDDDTESSSSGSPDSLQVFEGVLESNNYCVGLWRESEQGVPSIDYLNQFDALIWSAGDYWNTVLDENDMVLLEQFNGNVLFEGSDIGFDNNNSAFLENNLHASFDRDIILDENNSSLVLANHELLDGITSIDLNAVLSPFPDSLIPFNAESVASWSNAESAIIAFETSGSKTGFLGFSVDSIENQVTRDLLILNFVEWLSETQSNSAPQIVSIATNSPVNEGETLIIDINAFDPDGDLITYSINSNLFDLNGSTFSWDTNYSSAGQYTFTVTVFDENLFDSRDVNVEVINVNRAPQIDSFSPAENPTINEGEQQDFNITKSDPDSDLLSVTWYLDSVLVLSDSDSYTFVADYNSAGDYKWRFPLVFDQWSELLKLFLSTSLLIFFQMTGLQSL